MPMQSSRRSVDDYECTSKSAQPGTEKTAEPSALAMFPTHCSGLSSFTPHCSFTHHATFTLSPTRTIMDAFAAALQPQLTGWVTYVRSLVTPPHPLTSPDSVLLQTSRLPLGHSVYLLHGA